MTADAHPRGHGPGATGGRDGDRRRRSSARLPCPGGFVATELAAALGLLVIPVAILVVSLPVWAEVQAMGRTAAQQAARAAVQAPDADRAHADATIAATTVVTNHGRSLAAPVRLSGSLRPSGTAPQALITATVTVELPLVDIPLLGELTAVDWAVSHTQPVDVYRSRPAGRQ